jgi:hypothetical protein
MAGGGADKCGVAERQAFLSDASVEVVHPVLWRGWATMGERATANKVTVG